MTSSLPASVSSPKDLALLILDIKKYAKWFLQYYNANKSNVKYSSPQPEISKIASEIIIYWDKQKPLTPTSLETYIKILEKTARTAPVLTITLASPASLEAKEALAKWCRENLHSEILISFQYSSAILGGMILRTGSKIYDWSFRKKITENSKPFTEVLGNA